MASTVSFTSTTLSISGEESGHSNVLRTFFSVFSVAQMLSPVPGTFTIVKALLDG